MGHLNYGQTVSTSQCTQACQLEGFYFTLIYDNLYCACINSTKNFAIVNNQLCFNDYDSGFYNFKLYTSKNVIDQFN